MFEESSTALFICLIVLMLCVILITVLVLLIYSGLFTSAKEVGTGKPPLGKVIIAYKFQKGPYSEAGQIFTEAHVIAPDNKSLGIYYDDPRKVPASELRYAVGSIMASDSSDVDSEMLNRFTQKGYKMMTLPEVEFSVKTSFPHITTFSVLIAIQKVYPQLAQYIEERKLCAHPFLEYYDGKDIHFVAPLSKQEEFWVSECQDGRDETVGDVSEMNTTLDTSHSVLDESLDISPRASPDVTNTSVDSEPVSTDVGAGGDLPSTKDGEKEAVDADDDLGAANGGDDEEDVDDDNSSSSSFEVLKNEPSE